MTEETDFLDDFAAEDMAEFAGSEADAIEATPVEGEPEGEAAPSDGPARGPDGKFIRKEAATAAEKVETGEQIDAEVPPTDSEGNMVPVSVVQALRKEIQELKAGRQQQPPQPAPERPAPPNPQEDPFGYLNQNIQSVQETQFNGYLNQSELIARQSVGDEPVDAALEDFKQNYDPSKWQEIVNAKHPYGALLNWHKEYQSVREVREAGSLEALIEKRVAAALAQQGTPQQQAQPSTATPPSLAKRGGGTKADQVVSEQDVFDSMFDG